jgi:general secretion pathway protein N
LKIAAFGILAYVAALAALAPPSFTTHLLKKFSHERLEMRNPQGSAWAGSARLYARRGAELMDLGELSWRIRFADVALSGAAHASIGVRPWGVAIRGLDATVPAAALALLDPALQALGPQGTVRIRSERLRIDAGSVLGLAEVEWRDARLERARGLPLGSHVARLRGAGARVDIELASLAGPLQIEGGGNWAAGGAFRISGSAHAANAPLVEFLRGVCAEQRGPRCFFRYSKESSL